MKKYSFKDCAKYVGHCSNGMSIYLGKDWYETCSHCGATRSSTTVRKVGRWKPKKIDKSA